ncbi:hypothetical protein JCM5350_006097 [Sporobolomyces pararoseus]
MQLTTRNILDLSYRNHKPLALAGIPALVRLTLDGFDTSDPRNVPQPLRLLLCNIPIVQSLAMWTPSGNTFQAHGIQLVDGSVSLRYSQLFRTRTDNSNTVPLDLTYAKGTLQLLQAVSTLHSRVQAGVPTDDPVQFWSILTIHALMSLVALSGRGDLGLTPLEVAKLHLQIPHGSQERQAILFLNGFTNVDGKERRMGLVRGISRLVYALGDRVAIYLGMSEGEFTESMGQSLRKASGLLSFVKKDPG